MEVVIYINGIETKEEDIKNTVIGNPIILAILQKIDERIMTMDNQPKKVVAKNKNI
jgi:hypothetical protein